MPRKSSKTKMNINVNFDEGLFYIPYTDFYRYHEIKNPDNIVSEKDIPKGKENEYEYDETMTQIVYNSFRTKLAKQLCKQLPSLTCPDDTTAGNAHHTKRLLAENKIFQIVLEDNVWSVAVELKRQSGGNRGLQNQMFKSFLKNLRDALFEQFDIIYVRDGSWTAVPIDSKAPLSTGNAYITIDDKNQAYVPVLTN